MQPAERRRASIEAKGLLAALVGFSDAMAAQFKLQGLSEASIDTMTAYYLSRKKDPESVAFFGQDWPEYYKAVRQYLISQVPEANRAAFVAELDSLTHERVFNETVLPDVLGEHAMQRSQERRLDGESTAYDKMKYKLELLGAWTQSKNADPTKNEDAIVATNDVLVLADGATDKTGIAYPSGKSGGRELADIAAHVAANSNKSGYELADEVTEAVRAFYKSANPEALSDPSKRAATTLVVARITGDKTVVTQIGDSNIRITFKDGHRQVFTNDKLIDEENAYTRSQQIQNELYQFKDEHGREPNDEERSDIVASGRSVIQQRLNEQFKLQNNANDRTFGYGTIDGTTIPRTFTDGTPSEFVKQYVFESGQIDTIELVSDGFYGAFPDTAAESDYAELYDRIHSEDPDKYLTHLSTKPNDDATVLIARLI
jgi:serine/threonine protein phosphatase PrpC